MAPSSAVEAKNEPGTPSPTESAFSAVFTDGEVGVRNTGKKSLAQELEDVMERNKNSNEDAQTVAENPVKDTVFTWLFTREVECFTSFISYAEALELVKRVYEERHPQDGAQQPELTTAAALVVTIVCCLLALAAAHYAY
ncbi:hypothetical protein FAGAP_11608 [Fusarium agapanthi]|uniref:Uncharacterized protein n=1 Tax=Fusarium agapanthi TaxID=1803897 RepID=A0A9P5E742_9HYPO|nr:hypothetical protein FAGAP_11608 [Fusarium agapanthi]